MNLFSDPNSDPNNGHRSGDPLNTLNNHNNPNVNTIEDEEFRQASPQTIRTLRKSFIFLIVVGLVVGVFVAAGINYILNRFDVTGQPEKPPVEQVQ